MGVLALLLQALTERGIAIRRDGAMRFGITRTPQGLTGPQRRSGRAVPRLLRGLLLLLRVLLTQPRKSLAGTVLILLDAHG